MNQQNCAGLWRPQGLPVKDLLEKNRNSQPRLDIHHDKTDKPLRVLLILYQPSKLHLHSIDPQKKEWSVFGEQTKNQIRNLGICLVVTNISKDDTSKMLKAIRLDNDTKNDSPR